MGADTSANILSSVSNFNSRVATFVTVRGDKPAKLSTQPWADTNTTKDCVAEAVRKIKQMVPQVQRKMQLYLANRETEFILFRPVRSNILSTFVNLLATLRSEYSFDDQTIIGCPTQEQLAAILASVMVVHVSSRSRVLNSSSREVSESPEIVARKMSTKSVKFLESTEEAESSKSPITDAVNMQSEVSANGESINNGSEPLPNGNSETKHADNCAAVV